jgi:hypothetical protein
LPTTIDDLLPEALAEALGGIIKNERREWQREHELALAHRDAIIADIKRENTELRVELRDIVNGFLARAEIIIEHVKDGAPGPQGEQGIPGPVGPIGERGEQGIQGIAGEKGDQGEQGNPGTVGEKGDKGDPGELGLKGEVGDRGEQGLQGERGERGETGETGEQGIQGERGLIGMAGVNGLPGKEGLQGEQGIQGIAGEPGEPGLNGKDGNPGEPGIAGKNGTDGADVVGGFVDREGNGILTLTNGKTITLGVLVGRDGERGPPGEPPNSDTIAKLVADCVDRGLLAAAVPLVAPDDVAPVIGRGISLLAESAAIPEWKKETVLPPINLIVDNGATVPRTKTITTSRDGAGNLVANVVEN